MILCGQKKHAALARGTVDLAFGDFIDLGGGAIAWATDRQKRAGHTTRQPNMIPATALQTARPLCTTVVLPDDFIL
jgi:hypothetical protein